MPAYATETEAVWQQFSLCSSPFFCNPYYLTVPWKLWHRLTSTSISLFHLLTPGNHQLRGQANACFTPVSTMLSLTNGQRIGELPTHCTRLFLIPSREGHLPAHFQFWLTSNNKLNKALEGAPKDGIKLTRECNLSTRPRAVERRRGRDLQGTSWSVNEGKSSSSKTAV